MKKTTLSISKRIVLILFTMVFFACSTAKHNTAAIPDLLQPDKNQIWQLVAMRSRNLNPASPVTLLLNPDTGIISGNANCNNYYAKFTIKPLRSTPEGDVFQLSVNSLSTGSTRCPDADMNAEQRYTALLEKADTMVLTAYTLTLYQRGKEILKFELQ